MWYYIKQSFLPFVYLFFMAMTAMAILTIGNELVWLKVILCLLNLGLYLIIVCAASYKDGQTALKERIANDLERMQIIRTGEDRPLKLKEEYKWWKGYFYGFLSCVPLLLLLAIHTVLMLIDPALNGAGVVASIIYLTFFAFFRLNAVGTEVAVAPTIYYSTLIALPIIMIATGVSYYMGARKIQHQQDLIKEKQRQIYGE